MVCAWGGPAGCAPQLRGSARLPAGRLRPLRRLSDALMTGADLGGAQLVNASLARANAADDCVLSRGRLVGATLRGPLLCRDGLREDRRSCDDWCPVGRGTARFAVALSGNRSRAGSGSLLAAGGGRKGVCAGVGVCQGALKASLGARSV
ncbi:pentapeptide repeat-containing protein [Streptomyces liangshanensis]|uniref:pentapeptide repeat-containing protein n=1 Tax=Streptomyces liangshanensis TaxID=2717324 RepID=UPI0036DD47C9